MVIELPVGLLARAQADPVWAAWLDRLPRLVGDLMGEWALSADGSPTHGGSSLVVPVRTDAGTPSALKITWDGEEESRHEGQVLQRWGGRGAVRIFSADPHRRALLLERLPMIDLSTVGEVEACEVVAGLYARLHVPALPYLVPVTTPLGRSLAVLAGLPRDAPIPRRMVEQAVAAGSDLAADPSSVGRIVHGDLRHEHVLAGYREPWLAISPRPMAGDPCYEPAPMLWSGWDSMRAAGDVRRALRLRFETLVDAAGLDEDRARDWVVVRTVAAAGRTVDDARRAGRRLDDGELEWITRCVTIIKAVQV